MLANIAQMESFSVNKINFCINFSYEDKPEALYAQELNPFAAMIERDIDRVPEGGAH